MTDHTAMDNRPDVQVKATVKIPRHEVLDPNSKTSYVIADVRFEVHCRFCIETLMTNDMLDAVRKAEGHENSQGHIYAKQEYQNVPVAPDPENAMANFPLPSADDLPYPPNHPRGQHGIETLANVEARMQELRNQDPDQMC